MHGVHWGGNLHSALNRNEFVAPSGVVLLEHIVPLSEMTKMKFLATLISFCSDCWCCPFAVLFQHSSSQITSCTVRLYHQAGSHMVVPEAGQRSFTAHISEPAPSTLSPNGKHFTSLFRSVTTQIQTQSCALFTAVVALHNLCPIKGIMARSDMSGGISWQNKNKHLKTCQSVSLLALKNLDFKRSCSVYIRLFNWQPVSQWPSFYIIKCCDMHFSFGKCYCCIAKYTNQTGDARKAHFPQYVWRIMVYK